MGIEELAANDLLELAANDLLGWSMHKKTLIIIALSRITKYLIMFTSSTDSFSFQVFQVAR